MSTPRILTLFAAGAAGLFAQQANVAGPTAGYVFDSRVHALRQIRGIPGAAIIGDALDLGAAVTTVWVAPRLDAALAVTADGARLYRLNGSVAEPRPLDGLGIPERVVFSPTGSAAALVGAGSVRIIRGLPDSPVISVPVDLPRKSAAQSAALAASRTPRTRPEGLAVSDDGAFLLFESTGVVQLISAAGNARRLADAGPGALVAFAPAGHDAAVIDAAALVLFADVAGPSTVRRLPGVAGAKGAAFSADGRKFFVAAAGVTAVDIASGDRAEIECACRITGLTRMGTSYRLTDLTDAPLWLLDAAQPEARVVFVPARILDVGTYQDPNHPPAGIRDVFVNGARVVRDEDYYTGLRIQRSVKTGMKTHFLFGRNEELFPPPPNPGPK
jgi:hypothetical protein